MNFILRSERLQSAYETPIVMIRSNFLRLFCSCPNSQFLQIVTTNPSNRIKTLTNLTAKLT